MLPLRIVLNALLMGSIPMWIRLTKAPSLAIGIVRLTIGAALTLAFFHKRIALKAAFSKHPTKMLLLGVCFAVHWYTYFEAIRRTSATLGLLSLSTFGIHVSWMSFVFGTERARKEQWFGILLACCGAFIAAPSLASSPAILTGFAFGMTSALFYSTIPHLHQNLAEYSHATRSVAQLGVAWLCFLPAVPFVEFSFRPVDWAILGVLGVFCTFIAHNLWISITTEVSPATSGLLYYLTIPVTMILDTFILGRSVGRNEILGSLLIAAGHFVGRLGKAKKDPLEEEPG